MLQRPYKLVASVNDTSYVDVANFIIMSCHSKYPIKTKHSSAITFFVCDAILGYFIKDQMQK